MIRPVEHRLRRRSGPRPPAPVSRRSRLRRSCRSGRCRRASRIRGRSAWPASRLTTFVLSVFNAKLVGNAKLDAVVLPIALFYGGIAQLLAGMWEFRKNNTFGALAFTSYGAFWMSLAAYVKFVVPGLPAADAHTATGIFLGAWTIFTLYMWVASLRTNAAVAAVFTVLLVTFTLLTFGEFNPDTSLTEWGGYFGIVTAVLAWYASFAGVTELHLGQDAAAHLPAQEVGPQK